MMMMAPDEDGCVVDLQNPLVNVGLHLAGKSCINWSLKENTGAVLLDLVANPEAAVWVYGLVLPDRNTLYCRTTGVKAKV